MITCEWCGQDNQIRFDVITIIHDRTKEERFALKCNNCKQPLLVREDDGILTFITISNIPPSAKEAIDRWNELI